jgi:hypothetical protein
MNREYKPLKLMPNIIYPTYQLHAEVANNETPVDDAMKIVILEVMAWLRERFRDLDMPQKLQVPTPDQYMNFDWSAVESFNADGGYPIAVAFREKDRAWALELREPDLGPRPEDTGNNRKPAPGRTFTTNIAVRIHDGIVDCGFRTMVSELKGETTPCEVFRLAVIKRLVENPLLGLKQDKRFKLIRKAHLIDNYTDLKQLVRFLGEEKRKLPAVIFVRCPEGHPCEDPEKVMKEMILPKSTSFRDALHPGEDALRKKLPADEEGYYEQVAEIAQHRMGYGTFFYLAGDLYKKYNELMKTDMEPGDSAIIIPSNTKGKNVFFKNADDPETRRINIKRMEDITQDFLKGQDIPFDGIWFLPEINRLNEEDYLKNQTDAKTLDQIKDLLNKQYSKVYSDQISQVHGNYSVEIAQLNKENRRLSEEIEKINSKFLAQEEAFEQRWQTLEDRNKGLITENQWLREKANLPKNPAEVADWVAKRYPGKLIFHPKAVSLMEDVKAHEVNMELLCSALEFLAEEYRRNLLGELSEDEMNGECGRKYSRPFLVTPQKGLSVETYSNDYKIKYFKGADGKLHESPLDYHLKVGNDSEKLLRIYFLYDGDKKIIVVGSLPKHLPTLSYS